MVDLLVCADKVLRCGIGVVHRYSLVGRREVVAVLLWRKRVSAVNDAVKDKVAGTVGNRINMRTRTTAFHSHSCNGQPCTGGDASHNSVSRGASEILA